MTSNDKLIAIVITVMFLGLGGIMCAGAYESTHTAVPCKCQ